MKPFVQTESGYTPTAKTIVLSTNDEVDLSKWGNPERAKANYAVIAANLYQWRRRGV